MFLHIFSDSPHIFWQSQVINWICGGKRAFQHRIWGALSIFHQNISRKWLSSSDPHPDPWFWHSFWHTIWKSFFLAYTLTFFLAFYLASILTHLLAYIVWHSFWHSIWYIFGDSLWLRSGGEHSDPELAVEVRRGTLWSGACWWGNTLIPCLLFGSGGECCDLALAVEVRRRRRRRRRRDSWYKI